MYSICSILLIQFDFRMVIVKGFFSFYFSSINSNIHDLVNTVTVDAVTAKYLPLLLFTCENKGIQG